MIRPTATPRQCVERLESDVRDVLERSIVEEDKLFLPQLLDRKLYVKVDKIIGLLGGKWNRAERAHIFSDSAELVIADAVETGVVTNHRKTFQFFETPPAVAAQLVKAAAIEVGQDILEPSAGRGRIIEAIRDLGIEPVACELMDANRHHLKEKGVELVGDDFLNHNGSYDRIVANPPFSRGQDMAHVTHAFTLLRPGGRVAAIMSPGWVFRATKQAEAFRSLVAVASNSTWTMLPDGAFQESGTDVRAGILVLERAA